MRLVGMYKYILLLLILSCAKNVQKKVDNYHAEPEEIDVYNEPDYIDLFEEGSLDDLPEAGDTGRLEDEYE
tara:strand:+ start:14492 stop:14704 length:213 start_codon:yes stop_codon:yes gene_type:complete